MSDSDSEVFKELLIARWWDRFIAWLIDFIIISAISLAIMALIFGNTSIEWNENTVFSESVSYFPASILFFFYWVISEYKTGQSIGKKILHLKTLHINGKPSTLIGIIISSFGKSFLLPVDMILGLIFTNQKRQRIFNKIGDTIVIKLKDSDLNSENISYKKD